MESNCKLMAQENTTFLTTLASQISVIAGVIATAWATITISSKIIEARTRKEKEFIKDVLSESIPMIVKEVMKEMQESDINKNIAKNSREISEIKAEMGIIKDFLKK